MKRFALIAAFVLGSCNHAPPPVIRIPVPTNCVHGQIPQEPPHVQDQLTGDSGLDIGIIGGSAIQLRAWGVALYGMLIACQATPASTAPMPASSSTSP